MLSTSGKALTISVFGARGTGKTAWIKQTIRRAKPSRLLIWDYKKDPSLEDVGTAHRSLKTVIEATRAPRFLVRYLVDDDGDIAAQFELFCKIAYNAGCLLMFVDELPEVTKANKAPPAWRKCVNVGRDYRDAKGNRKWLSIIGAGQRAAECDKSFISNADITHVGRLNNLEDAQQLSKVLGCSAKEILSLPDLHYIEKDASKTTFSKGILKFSNPRNTNP